MADEMSPIGDEVQKQLESIQGAQEVEESSDVAQMPVDWAFEPENLKDMTPEQKIQYDIEVAEKVRRLHAGLEGIGNILTAAGIRYEGETPREILDKLFNPDKHSLVLEETTHKELEAEPET